jgi:hypothetical protein
VTQTGGPASFRPGSASSKAAAHPALAASRSRRRQKLLLPVFVPPSTSTRRIPPARMHRTAAAQFAGTSSAIAWPNVGGGMGAGARLP